MLARPMAQMFFVVVLCGVAIRASANPKPAPRLGDIVDTPAGAGYTLVFADEFNGRALNTALWNYRVDRKLRSAQRPQNVSEGNGVLRIALRKQEDGKFSYTGGGIVSRRTFRYGYSEVRVRTTSCAGWHSAFWAQAADPANTYNAFRRTEIDALEVDGREPRDISQGVVAWQPANVSDANEYKGVDIGRKASGMAFDTATGWHTYGFAWDEQKVRFFVDGQQTDVAVYPARENVHDAINLWLTVIATRNVDDSCLPASVQFDYVRYYMHDLYIVSDGDSTPKNYSETGHWEVAAEAGFTRENRTRVSRERGAEARWKENMPSGGRYTVYTYVPPGLDNDPATQYTVTHAGMRSSVVINTKQRSGWVQLGQWYFRKGDQATVVLRRSSGAARADAVKFVREAGKS